jgi:hypothetical protein
MNYYRKLGFKPTRNVHLARDIILGIKLR